MPLYLDQAPVVITSGASRLLQHTLRGTSTLRRFSKVEKLTFQSPPQTLDVYVRRFAVWRNDWDLSYIRLLAISAVVSVFSQTSNYTCYVNSEIQAQEMSAERPVPNTFSMTWATLLHSFPCYRLIFPSVFAHTPTFLASTYTFFFFCLQLFLLLSLCSLAPLFIFSIQFIWTLCHNSISTICTLSLNFWVRIKQDVCNCTFKKSICKWPLLWLGNL